MSSRSFRRRNSRRRHKPGTAQDGQAQRPAGEPADRPAAQDRPQKQGAGVSRKGASQRRDGRPAGEPGKGNAPKPPPVDVPQVFPDCPVCGKPVRELASALTHRVSRQPAHFECIMKELRESNEIAPQERICYLGSGCFGILEFHPSGGPSRFVIRKRIQYEEKETPQDWKKPLQIPC